MILTVNFYIREHFFFNQGVPEKGLRKELVIDGSFRVLKEFADFGAHKEYTGSFKVLEEFIDYQMRTERALNKISKIMVVPFM